MSFRLMILLAVVVLSGCNRPADYAVVGSAEVPSVHGDVEIEKIDKQQVLVTVVLDQLPAPGRIEPDLVHYVVWFVAVGEEPVRQGELEYDTETRSGRASFPTTLREFEMRVTAESTPEPTAPNYVVVASQQIQEN
ncbi:MAG: hypothetical protein AAGF92_05340 [Myxococcota bacterium]